MKQVLMTIILLISLNCVIELTKSYQIVEVFNFNDPINDNNLKKTTHPKKVIVENFFYIQPNHNGIGEHIVDKKSYKKEFGHREDGNFIHSYLQFIVRLI